MKIANKIVGNILGNPKRDCKSKSNEENPMGQKQYEKIHRFKGEGPRYWCDICEQYHMKHSDIGAEHWPE